jgi:hypothetical protein
LRRQFRVEPGTSTAFSPLSAVTQDSVAVVAKHFELTITDHSFQFSLLSEKIAAEAALDGTYVIRTGVAKRTMSTAGR